MAFVAQKIIHNPDASIPLYLPIIVQTNTPDAWINRNVRINSARANLRWVKEEAPHDRDAVMVGGGPSAADFVQEIRDRMEYGAVVFALNGASTWLNRQGIVPDYQVIGDAQDITATLVDPQAKAHLFASQVSPLTMNAVADPIVWHTAAEGIEDLFPPERVRRGGYAMFGGGCGVGTSAMSMAYGLGYRRFHVYGYDSCNKGSQTHAYRQEMNKEIPTVEVEWGGKKYIASVGMYGHAASFQRIALALKDMGCTIEIYGEGLCQTMYRTPPGEMTEQDKYRLMWADDAYRTVAPGENAVAQFAELTEPDRVIDFGCGTGRASLRLLELGYSPFLVDFAENCRDVDAMGLPFICTDLTRPMYQRAPLGFCVDVMEHIPADDVEMVIRNILASAEKTFFQIATYGDGFGYLNLGIPLHNTVRPTQWWADTFDRIGCKVLWQQHSKSYCRFFVQA